MKVKYIGGIESYAGCSDPKVLTIGKEYEVVKVDEKPWQTNYFLKGVNGYFNSIWFETIRETYFAYSNNIPLVGKNYFCFRLSKMNSSSEFVQTSTVLSVEPVLENVYKVVTRNSVYLVMIK